MTNPMGRTYAQGLPLVEEVLAGGVGRNAGSMVMHYLTVLADPTHEEHDHLSGWRGPFDPKAFDLALVNAHLRDCQITGVSGLA